MLSVFQIKGNIQKEIKLNSVDIKLGKQREHQAQHPASQRQVPSILNAHKRSGKQFLTKMLIEEISF